jgi:hypothetical protein
MEIIADAQHGHSFGVSMDDPVSMSWSLMLKSQLELEQIA